MTGAIQAHLLRGGSPRDRCAMARHVISVGLRGPGATNPPAGGRMGPRGFRLAPRGVVPWKGGDGLPRGGSRQPGPGHRPVMVEEVVWALAVGPQGGLYVDGTVGGGGHARAILERSSPNGQLIGIDRDPEALDRARHNLAPFGDRVILRQGNYAELREILAELGVAWVRGVLLDLGASYEQLTSAERGFSFRGCGPLDMRFGPDGELTAQEIVNSWPEPELRDLFRSKGEEPWAARIARAIVRARPIDTTAQLAELVAGAVPARKGRIHPATRVFQALRMEVNQELYHIERGVEAAAQSLEPGGRFCVITYHSLEDRLVKVRMGKKVAHKERFRLLTSKPIRPTPQEVAGNPSARSAKLRVLERIREET